MPLQENPSQADNVREWLDTWTPVGEGEKGRDHTRESRRVFARFYAFTVGERPDGTLTLSGGTNLGTLSPDGTKNRYFDALYEDIIDKISRGV